LFSFCDEDAVWRASSESERQGAYISALLERSGVRAIANKLAAQTQVRYLSGHLADEEGAKDMLERVAGEM
jgi:hypothetical protein